MKRRNHEDLDQEFGVDAAALKEEILRLEGVLVDAEASMALEYATISPNARAHAKLNIHNHGDETYDIRFAHEFAEIYLEQSLDGGIHGDPEAAAVWRWVSEWEYMDGYPKTPEQVRKMVEEKKIHAAPGS